MGYIYDSEIRAAARYLVRVLTQAGGKVAYGDVFYDGTEETHERLAKAIDDDEDYDDSGAEHAIDLAISQLEKFGFVETKPLPRELDDGFPDFEIEFTAKARRGQFNLDRLPFYTAE